MRGIGFGVAESIPYLGEMYLRLREREAEGIARRFEEVAEPEGAGKARCGCSSRCRSM